MRRLARTSIWPRVSGADSSRRARLHVGRAEFARRGGARGVSQFLQTESGRLTLAETVAVEVADQERDYRSVFLVSVKPAAGQNQEHEQCRVQGDLALGHETSLAPPGHGLGNPRPGVID